jgi:NAD+ diphosphatase
MRSFVPGHAAPDTPGEQTLWLAFAQRRILVVTTGGGPELPTASGLSRLGLASEDQAYLGRLGDQHCFAVALADETLAPPGTDLVDLRALLELLAPEQRSLASRASQIVSWRRTQRYCGRCGSRSEDKPDEHARVCPSCGLVVYPRLSPAVIVAVVRDGRLLLARAPRFKAGIYSVLAGFVEPGETLEECVHREVREEVGVEVRNVRYFGSQSWPFPDSLMVGFTAEHAAGEIRPDPAEVVDAGWFSADALPRVPSPVSIARALIDWFVEQQDQGGRAGDGASRSR